MSYYISVFIFALMLPLQSAFACGSSAGGIKPGDKTLAIELSYMKDRGEVVTNYAIDDDGAMVAAMVTSYCNFWIPKMAYQMSEAVPREQSVCMIEAQDALPWDQKFRDSDMDDDAKMTAKAAALAAIKAKCALDLKAVRAKLKAEIGPQPLSCAKEPEVGMAIAKAKARLADYIKEQSDPAYLAQMQATPAQKTEYIAALRASFAEIQKLSTILSNPSSTNAQLQAWLKTSVNTAFKRHGFQIASTPTEEFNAEKVQSIYGILARLNADLPGLQQPDDEIEAANKDGRRRVHTACARFGIDKSTIKNFSTAQWTARSAAAPGVPAAASGDAK